VNDCGGWTQTVPALLKATFNGFTAGAQPAPLRHVLQVVEQRAGAGFFFVVGEPDFGLALVGRELPGNAAQKIALHAGGNTGLLQHINPQSGDGDIGGTRQSEHAISVAVSLSNS
jgi:hypothetical protein